MSDWFWKVKKGTDTEPKHGDLKVRSDGASVKFISASLYSRIEMVDPRGKKSIYIWTTPDTFSYFTNYIDAFWPIKKEALK